MVVNREIIQSVRHRRAVRELEALLAQGSQLAQTLLQQSGLLEQGVDPGQLKLTPAQLEVLLAHAARIESELLAGDAAPPPEAGRKQV